jgi:ribosomal protein S18 acetylase RimI-like enzyme
MRLQQLTDCTEIDAVLETDRLYAAYAIGDLEPGLFELSEWHAAKDDDRVVALCLYFRGLTPPALFALGTNDGIAAILDSALQPAEPYITCRLEQLPIFRERYALRGVQQMLRMVIAADDFHLLSDPRQKRLGGEHFDALRRLYALGGGDAFAPYQLDNGVYFGIEIYGELVSAAGTHLVAPDYGIACVGNVATHTDHRNRGYATACTSAVVAELFRQGYRDIVLNVNEANTPAIRAYKKLGFKTYCRFIESLGKRKS